MPPLRGPPPIALDYHELMKHSVWCRAEEIEHWYPVDIGMAARLLSDEHVALAKQITDAGLAPRIRERALGLIDHLPVWAEALIATQ